MEGFVAPRLAVDGQGDVYVAGFANSSIPIPAGSNPFEASIKDVAVLELNSSGTTVLHGTYLGGSGSDLFGGFAIDSTGDVYLSGTTTSNDFPLQNPLQSTLGSSGTSAFVTEFNPSLSSLVYSTYLGANSSVTALGPGALALDASGDAYVVGFGGPGFPTTAGAYQSSCPDSCVFLAELNPTGSSILRASYLGSGGVQAPPGVALDSSNDVYIAGVAISSSFPWVNPIQSCSSLLETFLSEFSPAGALTFSTCLGVVSADAEGLPTLALDDSGNAYVAGNSQLGLPFQSPIDMNPPLTQGVSQGARPFVSEIDHATHALLFSTFFGDQSYLGSGSAGDEIFGIAVDPSGNIYLAGELEAALPDSPFPVFNAMQPYFPLANECTGPELDCFLIGGFVMKISPAAGAAAATSPGGLYVFGPSQSLVEPVGVTSAPQALTVYDLGTDPLTVSNVAITGAFAIQSNTCTNRGTVRRKLRYRCDVYSNASRLKHWNLNYY